MEQEHKRRVRYKGTHPRNYREKYKELNPEKYQADVEKIIQSGKTPAGTHIPIMVREILDFLQIVPGEQGCDAEEFGCVQGSTDLEALGEGSDIHDAAEGDGTVSDQACKCVPSLGLTSTNLLRIRNRCELGTVEPASLGSGEIREFGDDFIEF